MVVPFSLMALQRDPADPTWPYGPPPVRLVEVAPTWECPGGECVCHPTDGEREHDEHTIFFHDDNSRRMANARCRVFYQGVLLPTGPNAGGDGSLVVKV